MQFGRNLRLEGRPPAGDALRELAVLRQDCWVQLIFGWAALDRPQPLTSHEPRLAVRCARTQRAAALIGA